VTVECPCSPAVECPACGEKTEGVTNAIAGHGQYSHTVPTVTGQVVEIRDGQHRGTHVWRAEDGTFCFASLDNGTLRTAKRCLLLRGQDVEAIDGDDAYGCDLDSPDGLILIGCDLDDDLSWLTNGAAVLWDSRGDL